MKINKEKLLMILPGAGFIITTLFLIIGILCREPSVSAVLITISIINYILITFFLYKSITMISILKKKNQELTGQRNRQLRELDMARQIQQSLLTHKSMISPELKIIAHSRPAEKIGGDFYTLTEGISSNTSSNNTAKGIIQLTSNSRRYSKICIGDVAGHGVASALIMLLAQAIMERHLTRISSPSKVLSIANKEIKEQIEQSEISFVTAAVLQIDLDTLKLSYSKAGHTDAILIHNDGSTELLSSDGVFLGMFDSPQYEEKELQLKKGDRIFCYTDGITEAKSPLGELYGVDRLKDFMSRNINSTIEDIAKNIYKEIETFSESSDVNDDATVVLIEVN